MRYNNCYINIARLIFLSLTLAGIASAQEKSAGPFAFVNALDSDKPTFIYLNGDSYKPKGYLSGQMTYGGRAWAGQITFLAENEELGRSSLSIEVKPTWAPIVIAYAQERELEDGSIKRELKLKALAPDTTGKTGLSGLYASNTGNSTLLVNNAKYLLEPFKLTSTAPQKAVSFRPENSQQKPVELLFEKPAHFIAIVYDLKNGYQSAVVFNDISGQTSKE